MEGRSAKMESSGSSSMRLVTVAFAASIFTAAGMLIGMHWYLRQSLQENTSLIKNETDQQASKKKNNESDDQANGEVFVPPLPEPIVKMLM